MAMNPDLTLEMLTAELGFTVVYMNVIQTIVSVSVTDCTASYSQDALLKQNFSFTIGYFEWTLNCQMVCSSQLVLLPMNVSAGQCARKIDSKFPSNERHQRS